MEPEDLKAWRNLHRLTQGALATALGVSRRTLASWEQGETPIPHLADLACLYLHEHPEKMKKRARRPGRGSSYISKRVKLRVGPEDVAGVVEVALAGYTLAQKTIEQLRKLGVIKYEDTRDICNAAIMAFTESPAGKQLWTRPVVNLLREAFYDMEPSARAEARRLASSCHR